ncbi:DnaD domain-containing protein [Sporosalibacterium faouarense]|uniref:DnaD domain-containing protein n=1 Tax=Sporosalibacterium faouarense TaxID=516123 RepID=UPI00141C7A47|nr:DnaD domain protein [Sporosalibacterium faouarense]MTI46233.1 DnaD domain protein [Bacillota bacterium]
MSFVIQTTDMDLGDTPIENIFINDFMPMADGTYVKVYLLGYKYAMDKDENISLNNLTIAKHLDIPLTDVLNAWDFWENKGIIKKHKKENNNEYDYSVEFLNLKQLYINNNYRVVSSHDKTEKPNTYSCSVKDLVEANNIPGIQDMFNTINDIIRRTLAPNEKMKILEWIQNYNMNPDIIIKAYFYSVEKKGKRNVQYVGGIIRNWYDMNITNIEALEEHYKSKEESFYKYERIMKSLGFKNRLLSEGEMKVINKWFDKWKFTLEVVLKACENTKNISNPNVNYIDKILEAWYDKGISSVDDIEKLDRPSSNNSKNFISKPASSKNNGSKKVHTKFHNFEQRTSSYSAEDLEKVARNIRKKHTNR